MNDFELEQMMNGTVASLANPGLPEGLEERLIRDVVSHPRTNVLPFAAFGTLDSLPAGSTRKTVWGALALHAAVIALLMVQIRAMHDRVSAPVTVESEVLLNAPPVPLPPSAVTAGGGGGHKGPTPVTQGNPPRFVEHQMLPPEIHPVEDAKLPTPPTVEVQPDLEMAQSPLPQLGMPNSPLVGASLGNGKGGGGLGAGDGPGIGGGSNGGIGGAYRRPGGGVSAPEPIFTPDAEFSEEARKAKFCGNVLVYLVVDDQGRPTHVRVIKPVGLGLDEKAVEAVRQYRFKPARENGKAVAVEMNVEVNFTIF
jgi:protein TonB